MKDDPNAPHHWEHFATTPWTTVLAAGSGVSPDAEEALPSLCQAYWYPLYAYVRRLGYQANDACPMAFWKSIWRLAQSLYVGSAAPA